MSIKPRTCVGASTQVSSALLFNCGSDVAIACAGAQRVLGNQNRRQLVTQSDFVHLPYIRMSP
jgi:hypothetical protein